MENEETQIDLENMSLEELEALSNQLTNEGYTGEEASIPTDTPVEQEVEQPNNTQGDFRERADATEPGKIIPGSLGLRKPRPGIGGFVTDVGQNMYEGAAPAVGLVDTITDAINFVTPKGIPDIPKLPEYEEGVTQAVRNISGLIIPTLLTRGMILTQGARVHQAGVAAPWLQKLGNQKSFQYFAKFGADIFSGGMVDYIAEQNQRDDNLFGTLKHYWPKTFQFIPESIATTKDDSAGDKRAKNVNEGAIFGVLASIIEGVAFLTKAGRSMNRTAKFIPSNEKGVINVKDQFSDIKFSDNPVEDSILRGYARKEYELNLLNRYFQEEGLPTIDWNLFDEGETLVRTRDADNIFGALADNAQIFFNVESSYGRIGNLLHEAARKQGIKINNLSNRTLVSELIPEIKKGGPFKKILRSGTVITEKMIRTASEGLAATLLNPRLEPDEIIGVLNEFKRSIDDSAVRITGKKGINKAVKGLVDQLIDLDAHKARALLTTSEAGQVSDFAEGARLMEDGASVMRTVDLMADRLEVLMVEKALATFEANSIFASMNSWKAALATGDKDVINTAAEAILGNHSSRLTEIIPKVKAWTETLKAVGRENPKFLRPLLLASEFTDGNVDSMFKLHDWAANNLSTFKKALYDANPEVPSIVNKAMWSNIFNSALSALATPIKAGVGNLTGLFGRGAASVTGAVLQGDFAASKKAMVAHFSLDDTLQKATDHLKVVFKKASNNPKQVSYVMRGDIAIQEEKGLTALRAFADAASEEGEDGAKMVLSVYEDLDALAQDPVLRFGGNSMTALDGFAKSVTANTEAKYRVLNRLAQSGEVLDETSFKKAYQEVYDNWFDSNGMISNEAVDSITSEIALNADSPIVEGMNNFIKRFPAARSFIWFPRTTANVIDTFGKWSPAGILSSDYQELWGPLGRKSLDEFSPQQITDFLRKKGRPIDEFAMQTFEMLRYEVKGKAALGSLFITMAGFAAINDRCTGNGHYDKSIQRQRIRSGWKPKSCRVPGTDKQVSYDWMGPLGDWLSLTVDVVDNFDSLSAGVQEDLYNKLMFVFGSAFTNRSILSQLEPLHDVLQGNGAAATRFMTSMGNNLVPLGSLRNELGKVMYPQLRQIRAELDENLRNRNAWLDAFDPERALPAIVDPIDGREIGNESNWFIRVINRGPFKVNPVPSPERQFLINIEFNHNPSMRLSQGGAVLENHEITAINSIIGKQGFYKQEIQRIMKIANKLTYTAPDGTVYKGFTNILQAQRRGFITSEMLNTGKYERIFSELTLAYNQAKNIAEDSLGDDPATAPILASIREREYAKQMNLEAQQAGDIDTAVEEALNMPK